MNGLLTIAANWTGSWCHARKKSGRCRGKLVLRAWVGGMDRSLAVSSSSIIKSSVSKVNSEAEVFLLMIRRNSEGNLFKWTA